MNDTVKLNLETKQIEDFFPLAAHSLAYVSDGTNRGRVGAIVHIAKLDGNFDLVTLRDAKGHAFTTRANYVFAIGRGTTPSITLPRAAGVKLTIIEEADLRAARQQ